MYLAKSTGQVYIGVEYGIFCIIKKYLYNTIKK